MMMHLVGLKVLKNKLSEYVCLAAQGETVLITNHDTVVAEIVPLSPGRSELLADAMLADAYRKGLITPAANPSEAIPPADPVMTLEDLMRDLGESAKTGDLSRQLDRACRHFGGGQAKGSGTLA